MTVNISIRTLELYRLGLTRVCVVYGFHKRGETDNAGMPGVTGLHEELLPTHRKAYMPSFGLDMEAVHVHLCIYIGKQPWLWCLKTWK